MPALGRLRHENLKLKASLGYIARPYFKKISQFMTAGRELQLFTVSSRSLASLFSGCFCHCQALGM
jgi:hypothetical protein